MRVVPYVLFLILICVAAPGCALFGQKSGKGGNGWLFAPAKQEKKPAASVTPLYESAQGDQPKIDGILAGRVVEKNTGLPVAAYIRYSCLDGPKQDKAPIDVSVGPKGYFTIHGLDYGKRYKLEARTKQGSRKMAGIAYATAPKITVVIELDEAFVTPNTPSAPPSENLPESSGSEENNPPSSGFDEPKPPETYGDPQEKEYNPNQYDYENPASTNNRGFGIGRPKTTSPTQPELTQNNPRPNWEKPAPLPGKPNSYPPNIVIGDRVRPTSPSVKIESPVIKKPQVLPPANTIDGSPKPDLPPFPANSAVDQPQERSGAPIPSSVVVGKQVINFALNDFYGQPWEWKVNRRGKLVLLDFWKTNCAFCIQDMTYLRVLQEKHGKNGLEILGIASEDEGNFDDQKYRVIQMCNLKQTRHRMLMNIGQHQKTFLEKFNVQGFPTLILLDEGGNEIWRHTGLLRRADMESLENVIGYRLREQVARK